MYDLIVCYMREHNKRNKASLDSVCKNINQALLAMGINNVVYRTNKEIYKIYKFLNNSMHST